MENKTKKILIWEGIFIIGILIYLFFATAPKQIYPFSGMTISDPDFNFTIESNVALNLREKNESYELENKGNVDLNVSKKTGSLFTSDIVINVGESQEVEKDNSTYEGRQR